MLDVSDAGHEFERLAAFFFICSEMRFLLGKVTLLREGESLDFNYYFFALFPFFHFDLGGKFKSKRDNRSIGLPQDGVMDLQNKSYLIISPLKVGLGLGIHAVHARTILSTR